MLYIRHYRESLAKIAETAKPLKVAVLRLSVFFPLRPLRPLRETFLFPKMSDGEDNLVYPC